MPQPVTQLLPSPAQPAPFAGGPPLGPASPPTRTAPALGPTQTLRPEDFTFPVAFGNLEFPHEIRLYGPVSPSGNERYAMVETAEYVRGPIRYAQAFEVDQPMRLKDLSLALHRFGGGRGELWLELYDDNDGPGALLAKSRPVASADIHTPPNRYEWVPFSFEESKLIIHLHRQSRNPGRRYQGHVSRDHALEPRPQQQVHLPAPRPRP